MRIVVALLVFLTSIAVGADPAISEKQVEDLKAYIANRRNEDVEAIQKNINGLRKQDIPAREKVALRKQYEETLKNVKSQKYVPSLSLTSPKGIGIVELSGKASIDPYGRVSNVIGKDAFLMSVYQQVYDPPKSGRVRIQDAGKAIQDALLDEPREVHKGDLMVTGVSTVGIRDDRQDVFKISGTFVVEGTKTYTTVSGARKTVPLIRMINSDDLNAILTSE